MKPRSVRTALAVGAAVLVAGATALVATNALAATGPTATFSKSAWETGYTGTYTITNTSGATLNGWTLTFDLPAGTTLGSYWDALITSSGNRYTAKNREYNGTVAPGASASFGFVASGTGSPTNCSLNGASCTGGGGGGGTPPPPPPPPPGGGSPGAKLPAAPYLYLGWGNPPSATSVMSSTGIKAFTMAFMNAGGGCNPAWDSSRPLAGGTDQQTINAIRAAGGDIEISFGGWSGTKLGPNCGDANALAGAYQKVIDAYKLRVIDIDIENSDEFENDTVRRRIIDALKIVKQRNPDIKTVLTFGTTKTGPNYYGTQLINETKAAGANIDVYTIMPFDFGGTNMYTDTVNAAEGLKNALKSTFGWSDATAYGHMGISGMNGLTDQQEQVSPQTWTQIRDYAKSKGLARLAYWSVNRDRPCPGGGVVSNCSGIAQSDWEFTRISAGF
ncbi:chitinase [Planosporangium flavigriseum]|uniref:Chitinase n=1 Tax=Planosporangium flavigriseum TaxID=373681 RepID=A0A8J3LTV5_9ACTN|nr:cellulose binding domain-containing protein [Planosporangium flavigriseum]NJC66504.1 chitinase [Planosporangium flavigriseum]GIG76453.1 chitinase [Planosporangium flavigriseum]